MSRPVARVLTATLLVATVIASAPAVGAGAAGRQQGPDRYSPPTSAPIVDSFRPPPQPWVAGNRGIEYATPPGSPVVAIGRGTVAFAGPVAGRRVVTVVHPDGLRSSYVGLATVSVGVHDPVAVGRAVGTASERLHLGVRRGTTYIDPAGLWGDSFGSGRSVLVPGPRAGGRVGSGSPSTATGSWRASLLARSPWWAARSGLHLG